MPCISCSVTDLTVTESSKRFILVGVLETVIHILFMKLLINFMLFDYLKISKKDCVLYKPSHHAMLAVLTVVIV